ncbi:hypothetical protein AB8O55_24700 [Saccharopolyspora cebuensis]|uniref:Uncharacterized protein n=1 Tax=Saccharopolyspora cebuensis TaxID=418759 RepID=A0ABV4CQ37_9PSEU
MTDPRTSTALVVPPEGLSVWTLHWWHEDTTERKLFLSYEEALHHLATQIRDSWTEEGGRDALSASLRQLTDGQVVSLFYNSEIRLSPVSAESRDRGFAITEDHVRVSGPGEVDLRIAVLRVLDQDPEAPFEHPLTYQLEALGLSVAVFPGRDGPELHLSDDNLPPGLPVTITVDDVRIGSARSVHHLT